MDERAALTARQVGRRIRERREALGVAQGAFATRAGVSISYLSRLERGLYADPSATYLGRLALALGCSVSELLGGDTGEVDDRALELAFASARTELSGYDKHALTQYLRLMVRLSRERRGRTP